LAETQEDTKVSTNGHRGRPRPQVTIQRDERVIAKLSELGGTATRKDIAAGLGDSHPDVYRALCRLRTAGRVSRVHDGGKHVWKLTG
jgi:uncharacterized membrane protein